MQIAFFGSSLVSAYWNGAATYWRGIIHALAQRGHQVTFFEPDAYDRQQHRDMDDPDWARVVVYRDDPDAARDAVRQAKDADLVVKCSGVGVHDALLEEAVLTQRQGDQVVAFWDVDAPATLDRLEGDPGDPFHELVPRYDIVLTYGGGQPVIDAYTRHGAQRCVPIYNALDPETHHPARPDDQFAGDLAFLGNRLPDREQRVERFFLDVAAALPNRRFVLGGSGWGDKPQVCDAANVNYIGHVYTRDHNAFNCTPTAVLNISRESMARYGFSPATRVFEAAGAGACLITDAWKGIEQFLCPGEEVLVADDGDAVAEHLSNLTPDRAERIGQAALRRVLSEHTYAHRAEQLEALLHDLLPASATPA